jgi:hypothetical protein
LNARTLSIVFDVQELYYLPQYLPVYKELLKRNKGTAKFVFHKGVFDNIVQKIIEDENLDFKWVNNRTEANEFYKSEKADWIFFGNTFPDFENIHLISKSIQLGHGVGPKSSYYTKSDTPATVRFVEGNYRKDRLEQMYPNDNFVNVGFAKLDPLFNGNAMKFDLNKLGLNPNKKTITYAPTFYPSSIEKFPVDFPTDFKNFNILIKPHYFSMSKDKYKTQRQLLKNWAEYDNVYLAKVTDYSLVPFMATSDLLVSDASSAIIEFAALNKPVIWCNFLKLRWNYRGIFSYRLKQRMDKDYKEYSKIAICSNSYHELRTNVNQEIKNPLLHAEKRLQYAEKLAGKLDGKSSVRIIDYLLKNN